jgi:preprotein translocase subunit SecG
MYARATLWCIGSFLLTIFMYCLGSREEYPENNINEEKKADENTSQ